MDQIMDHLRTLYVNNIQFAKVEAEAVPNVSSKFNIQAVPTFIGLQGATEVGRVEGVDPRAVSQLAETLSQAPVPKQQATQNDDDQPLSPKMTARLNSLINSAPVMLFMKGSTEAPKCKFSRKIIEMLQSEGVGFASFNILEDEEVRQALKKHSNWPTYPQLYAKGELIGGVDIVGQLVAEGALKEACSTVVSGDGGGAGPTLEDRLAALIKQAPVMLFMKGSPTEPRCGFSRTITQILQDSNISFEYFDILSDEEVRQGLKTFSNWPTYPQLYVKGELIGGLDIVKELQEAGDLAEQIGVEKAQGSLDDRIKALITQAPVMLFMKGNPEEPRCGFSSKIIKILKDEGFSFDSFDILEDEEIRQGLKTFSNWPTYPQLYIKGELIGGLDIVQELHSSGELSALKT